MSHHLKVHRIAAGMGAADMVEVLLGGKRAEEAPDDKAMCKLPFCSEFLARYARVPRTILFIVLNRQRHRPAAIGFIDRDFG